MEKYFITKYSLTKGVTEVEGTVLEKYPNILNYGKHQYCHKPYWHKTKEEAVVHAEELRKTKLLSLQKQITKLEKRKF